MSRAFALAQNLKQTRNYLADLTEYSQFRLTLTRRSYAVAALTWIL